MWQTLTKFRTKTGHWNLLERLEFKETHFIFDYGHEGSNVSTILLIYSIEYTSTNHVTLRDLFTLPNDKPRKNVKDQRDEETSLRG